MDNLGKELLDFFAAAPLKTARTKLYGLLDTCGDEVNVYYLVSLSNLKSIIADGGIKCRARVGEDGFDLSAQYVQEMRDKTLQLAQKISSDKEIISKNLHECINFFWNPINNTFRAFQRNSLLIESNQHNDHRLSCLFLQAFFC